MVIFFIILGIKMKSYIVLYVWKTVQDEPQFKPAHLSAWYRIKMLEFNGGTLKYRLFPRWKWRVPNKFAVPQVNVKLRYGILLLKYNMRMLQGKLFSFIFVSEKEKKALALATSRAQELRLNTLKTTTCCWNSVRRFSQQDIRNLGSAAWNHIGNGSGQESCQYRASLRHSIAYICIPSDDFTSPFWSNDFTSPF